MKQSGRIALGGVLAALSLTFMLLTFFQFSTYALTALAGAVLIPYVIEAGARGGWMIYAAVAILSLFLAPDPEAKMLFVSFFGYYPVLKSQLERIRKRWLEWLLKLLIFNMAMVVAYLFLMFVFHLDVESFQFGKVNVAYLLLAAGNIVFIIYDFALTNLLTTYMRILHPKVVSIFRLNKQ